MKKFIVSLAVCSMMLSCTGRINNNLQLIDSNATDETKNLFDNLWTLSEKHTLFGHHHATEYGHGWYGDAGRSDVKSITGSHPAIIGIDFGELTMGSEEQKIQYKQNQQKIVIDTYNRGGVITALWNLSNPVSEDGFYWNDTVSVPAVKYIIPGGEAHNKYKEILDEIGEWTKSLKGSDGRSIPLIFRPFHEFDGGWFWWGAPHCSREEFISLWQFTVSYLRDSIGVHNFIYAFSPDNMFNSEAEYLARYPGNDWVDIVGVDNYGDMGRDRYDIPAATKKLKIVCDYAIRNHKLPVFTETGLESIPDSTWWTETLLKTMKTEGLRLGYVLVWRNDMKSPTHYYAPFPGQISVPDFIKFYDDPYTLFENDLEGIYE